MIAVNLNHNPFQEVVHHTNPAKVYKNRTNRFLEGAHHNHQLPFHLVANYLVRDIQI